MARFGNSHTRELLLGAGLDPEPDSVLTPSRLAIFPVSCPKSRMEYECTWETHFGRFVGTFSGLS